MMIKAVRVVNGTAEWKKRRRWRCTFYMDTAAVFWIGTQIDDEI